MRDAWSSWRKERAERAAQEAAEAAPLFERAEAEELWAAAERALHGGAKAAKEYARLCEEAGDHSKRASEWQEAARRVTDEWRLADRRGLGERDAVDKAVKTLEYVWTAATAEGQKEADAWTAAAAEAWKMAAVTFDCTCIASTAVELADEGVASSTGDGRKAARTRAKAARDWQKDMEEWARPRRERAYANAEETSRYAARAGAWAAGAKAMVDSVRQFTAERDEVEGGGV